MAGEIDIRSVAKAYARWAPVYDIVFGAVFAQGRKASIAAAERVGGRILDVGIGTGISLTGELRYVGGTANYNIPGAVGTHHDSLLGTLGLEYSFTAK